jgi:alkanesulfonate monooxygenase SsuD/methylene tetrahydromethanopterin reductase-like flavin-dependent oxidoreductase (luciferase family)
LTGYAIVEAYERYFRQIGFEPEVVAVLAKWRAGDRSGAVEGVSDDMTDRLAVFGSVAQCQVRLERYVRAGVNLPIIFPFSPEADFQTSIYRTLTKLGPGQSGRRPTTAS